MMELQQVTIILVVVVIVLAVKWIQAERKANQRQAELINALMDFVKLSEYAIIGPMPNGVTHQGMDEGEVLGGNALLEAEKNARAVIEKVRNRR